MQDFLNFKQTLREQIVKHNPCKEALDRFDSASTDQELWDVLFLYMSWLTDRNIDTGKAPDSIQYIGGYADLRDYNHPLPNSIQYIGGYADLRDYNHPLPNSIQYIGGDAYLRDYNHPLPNSIQYIGGDAYLRDYNHPLPEKCEVRGTIYR